MCAILVICHALVFAIAVPSVISFFVTAVWFAFFCSVCSQCLMESVVVCTVLYCVRGVSTGHVLVFVIAACSVLCFFVCAGSFACLFCFVCYDCWILFVIRSVL